MANLVHFMRKFGMRETESLERRREYIAKVHS